MNYSRRPDERRRRVMMTTGMAAPTAATASSRRRMEQLREARRPQVAYGSNVRKCLRGRWFSLVPVDRSTYVKFLAGLAAIVAALVFFHDASVRYATIADQPSWVDVLRISRYGSFGRYAIGVLYLCVAGAAWLVYQLRRYRNDDFSGNYQLWQWIVASALVASVSSAVPVLGMLGAAIDWSLGQRAALSGEDWIELFLMVGGAILALRTVAEMWRYRWSSGFMIAGWVAMAIPTAADWNMIDVGDLARWTVVTSAPLLAVAFWFAATVGYLRCLFREVRGIESAPGLMQRLRVVAADWTSEDDSLGVERSTEKSAASSNASKRKATVGSTPQTEPKRPASRVQPKHARKDESATEETSHDQLVATKSRRSWWPFGRSKSDDGGAGAEVSKATDSSVNEGRTSRADDSNDEPEPEKRKWWPSLKRKAKTGNQEETGEAQDVEKETDDTSDSKSAEDASESPGQKRRFGLGSIMKRRAASSTEDTSDTEESSDTSSEQASPSPSNASNNPSQDDKAQLNEDDIDWASMNKSERRRMRKQLKRGGKAA